MEIGMWLNKPHEVTALLIDGANAYKTQGKLGYNIDWDKLLKYFKPQQAYYYTALPERNPNVINNLFKMIDYISYNGYIVVDKPTKIYDNDGIQSIKGNMDAEIVLGMVEACEWANHIVLLSGDGDFKPAIQYVQRRGLKVTVVSTCKTEPSMVSDELRRQANAFIDMRDPEMKERLGWDLKDRKRAFVEGP